MRRVYRSQRAANALGRALLCDRFEPLADLRDVGAEIVDARQRRERLQPEHALEERRRAVTDRAELVVAAAFGDQAALDETRDDAVDVHAADPRDLRPRHGPEVRDD